MQVCTSLQTDNHASSFQDSRTGVKRTTLLTLGVVDEERMRTGH